jgi:hypothetical protein
MDNLGTDLLIKITQIFKSFKVEEFLIFVELITEINFNPKISMKDI